jgi:uncharacterized membrane protein
MPQSEAPAPNDQSALQTVLTLRARQREQVGPHQRLVERITLALGRPLTIYLTIAFALAWAAFNTVAPALSMPVLDPPPFSRTQGVIGLVAVLMTTMVLTTQNRQAMHAEQRLNLELQVSLLVEQKVAKLIALVEELRRDLPNVHDRKDSLAEAMTNAVDPGAVLSVLEQNPSVAANAPR